MAKSFASTKGEAIKGGEYYKWADGEQTIRLVGDIVPRYVYWKQSVAKKNVAVECLGFDRNLEKFTNIETDHFQLHFPDQNCSWAYVGRALNPADTTKTILIPLKKKMYAQIIDVAESLGDPTDTITGWDIVIAKVKTGSAAFNVEYTVKQLKCKTRELSDEEKAVVAAMAPIDELVPRQSAAEQKEYVQKMFFGSGDDTETDQEAADEVAKANDDQAKANNDQDPDGFDDIPF